MHRENFSCVFFPGADREVVQGDVKEFDTAVTTGGEDLILVEL